MQACFFVRLVQSSYSGTALKKPRVLVPKTYRLQALFLRGDICQVRHNNSAEPHDWNSEKTCKKCFAHLVDAEVGAMVCHGRTGQNKAPLHAEKVRPLQEGVAKEQTLTRNNHLDASCAHRFEDLEVVLRSAMSLLEPGALLPSLYWP